MNTYDQKVNLYFELKNTPESSRESYGRRIRSFTSFMKEQDHPFGHGSKERRQSISLP
ncbi:hypothetical protein QNH36_22425 [Mesobacillus sp. AQ2]|uniref:hypothetical protein n=1 Tax=Bacillaceae TaxID=186817 RepID=UPI0016429B1C|nr:MULTISPECIES: hypothetical protein [Bacillaceae]WHX40363.1 hypothetical protein QNH36_22425 [Mesobacillus sp. AQ2]